MMHVGGDGSGDPATPIASGDPATPIASGDSATPIAFGDEVDEIVAAWQRERPELDVAPLQVLSRLDRLAGVLGQRRVEIFARQDLRPHEFDVLAALRRNGPPFRLTAGELAARTHVTSGTMTSRLDGLVRRGLVTRAPDDTDGRLVRVELSDTGRAILDTAFEQLLAAERELLTPLAPDSLDALAAALRALLLSASSDPSARIDP